MLMYRADSICIDKEVLTEANKARFIRRTLHEPNLIPIEVDPNN